MCCYPSRGHAVSVLICPDPHHGCDIIISVVSLWVGSLTRSPSRRLRQASEIAMALGRCHLHSRISVIMSLARTYRFLGWLLREGAPPPLEPPDPDPSRCFSPPPVAESDLMLFPDVGRLLLADVGLTMLADVGASGGLSGGAVFGLRQRSGCGCCSGSKGLQKRFLGHRDAIS